MDSNKYSTRVDRLEVIETGRRRRWSDDEKLRIVIESLQTPRAISATARRHGISRSLLMTWRRSFRGEMTPALVDRTGFVPALVMAEPAAAPEKISQAPAPFHVIPRGWAGPSLLAMVLFEKFGQHQPLNRQAERYAKEGVPISLSTLADQVGGCTAALTPLFKRLEAYVLSAARLHGDDTTVPVLAKGKTDTGGYGSMSATTSRSAGRNQRARCSITRAIGLASIRRRIWLTTAESSRRMPMAAMAGSTSPAASLARFCKPRAGSTPGVRSSSWLIWPRTPVAKLRARRRR